MTILAMERKCRYLGEIELLRKITNNNFICDDSLNAIYVD